MTAEDIEALPSQPVKLVSGSCESTVVASAPVVAREKDYQSEAELEDAFLQKLVGQGYELVSFKDEEALLANAREQIEALNKFRFSDAEWERFLDNYLAPKNDGILEKTERVQLKDAEIYDLELDDGTAKNIKILDKRYLYNNRLQVMHQFTQVGRRENRYDVTVLVNGLPLVGIELKRRGVAIREAFNQIERYSRDSFWAGCGLFEYIQVYVISNGTDTKYYSNTTRELQLKKRSGKTVSRQTSNSFEFTSWWTDVNNNKIADLMAFAETFFQKMSLLKILTRYCVYTEDKRLLVMRPYQIAATEKILERILVSESNPEMLGSVKAGGYVWHTTGSGKTLTSFKTAQLAQDVEGVDRVIFVVDRKDLDYQTMCEYEKFQKGAVNANTSTKVLARQLSSKDARIIVTTIQKLSVFIKRSKDHPVFREHVVFIFDECHRSQFGDMHRAITKSFKNYHMFGFTGTPIVARNASSSGKPDLRTTAQAFGDELHTYTIGDAINDGNVLPFRVEYVNTMRAKEGMKDEKVFGIEKRGVYRNERRIHDVVRYILKRFDQKTRRDAGTYEFKKLINVADVVRARNKRVGVEAAQRVVRLQGFNSILAVEDIAMARIYYSAFKEEMLSLGKHLKVGLIYSFGVNDDTEMGLMDESFEVDALDASDRDFLDEAIKDYNRMFGTDYDTSSDKFENYYKDVSLRMKNRELDLLIVVNMFLTGFDATTLNTLWVDKPLKMHGLLQAFSRTNRILNGVKTYGNIVCFRNLEEEVNEAISLFGDKGDKGLILLKPYEEYRDEYYEKLRELASSYPPGVDLFGEEVTKDFIRVFGAILRLRNILVVFDEFEKDDVLSPRDLQDYTSMYNDVYQRVQRRDVELSNIDEDVVFEVDLIKSVDVNIDYIIAMVQKYREDNKQDKELRADVERAISSSLELRSKKDLVLAFLDESHAGEDTVDAWNAFVAKKREEELQAIISKFGLDAERTENLMRRSRKAHRLMNEGTEISDLMLASARPSYFAKDGAYQRKVQAINEALEAYFERFADV